ncbi:MAG: hypothetical protein O3C10_06730 [Chloroflexi bacterium]|nr:hypothetical protein [Chloroflexota bacterium]
MVVSAIAALVILAVACGGDGPNSDRNLGDVIVLTPTPGAVNCLNDDYPADAPVFGDDAAVAYQTLESGVAVFDHQVGEGSQPESDSEIRVHGFLCGRMHFRYEPDPWRPFIVPPG